MAGEQRGKLLAGVWEQHQYLHAGEEEGNVLQELNVLLEAETMPGRGVPTALCNCYACKSQHLLETEQDD